VLGTKFGGKIAIEIGGCSKNINDVYYNNYFTDAACVCSTCTCVVQYTGTVVYFLQVVLVGM
jgi:hypothetical protein